MNLIEFYKKVIKSLNLEIDKEDYIYVNINGKKTALTANGKQLVLPTKEHIDTAVTIVDGKPEVVKIPYNPLNEDVIKGDTLSLKKTKEIVENRLVQAFAMVGELLLTLASNPKLQKGTDMELNKFLVSLSSADNGNVKDVVDEKSINLWGKIYAKSMEIDPNKGLLKVYLKNGGRYDGVKYNRLAILTLPIYDELLEADRDTPIFGVKLRKKDIAVFKLLYEYTFTMLDENHTYTVGSTDNESPGFIALMKLYVKVGNRLNKILKSLTIVDNELVNLVKLHISITNKELDSLDIYKPELAMIPSELEFNRQKVKQPQAQQQIVHNTNNTNPITINTQIQPEQPEPEDNTSLVHKILYGGNVQQQPPIMCQPVQPVMQQPVMQPSYQQQPVYQQPVMQQPAQQPMYQQPMVQQPMYGQPMGGYQQPTNFQQANQGINIKYV